MQKDCWPGAFVSEASKHPDSVQNWYVELSKACGSKDLVKGAAFLRSTVVGWDMASDPITRNFQGNGGHGLRSPALDEMTGMSPRMEAETIHNNPLSTPFLWALALATYALSHCLFFGNSPGFHYDEAWAANFALKIARNASFWPLEAMSPQTHAIHHYWVAGWFWLFGPSVEVFRSAHVVLGLTGACLVGAALSRLFADRRLAPWFVLLAGVQPAIVANHRFAIELTSFHTLCFGGMLYFALRSGRSSRIASALFAVLGISSHIFFVAPALALIMTLLLENPHPSRGTQSAIGLGGLLSLPVILKLQVALPEKDKAAALMFLFAITLLGVWLLPAARFWTTYHRRVRSIILAGGCLALPLVVFLFEGTWAMLLQVGSLAVPALAGAGLLAVGYPLASAYKALRGSSDRSPVARIGTFWCCLAISSLAVAPKPAGRYFETLFLTSLAIITAFWIRSPGKTRWLAASWPVILSAQLLLPASRGNFLDHEIRFLIFRDRTTDFLPKQEALLPLASAGCSASQLASGNPRVDESIAFILEPREGRRNDCAGRRFRYLQEPTGLRIEEIHP